MDCWLWFHTLAGLWWNDSSICKRFSSLTTRHGYTVNIEFFLCEQRQITSKWNPPSVCSFIPLPQIISFTKSSLTRVKQNHYRFSDIVLICSETMHNFHVWSWLITSHFYVWFNFFVNFEWKLVFKVAFFSFDFHLGLEISCLI